MSDRDLRLNILKLLKDYTINLQQPIALDIIVSHFPNDSYKNVQVQLFYLKSKRFVDVRGPKGSYRYYITKRGLRWLNRLELYKLRRQMIDAFNEELQLYNSYS